MKTLMITGGTVNTGFAIAKHFASKGYGVALTGRNAETAQSAAEKIAKDTGATVKGYALELSDTKNIRKVFECVKNDFGHIDTFVANGAHLGVDYGLLNTTEEDFLAITNVNMKGTFFSCQCAAELMKETGGGSIVTIGSVQANGAVRGRTVYSMTKAAISALVKNMAYELGEFGIRANNIVAGAIHSNRWDELTPEATKKRRSKYPVGRESTEEEIANAVFYLGTDLSATVTGTDLTIDSGLSICLLPYEKSEK